MNANSTVKSNRKIPIEIITAISLAPFSLLMFSFINSFVLIPFCLVVVVSVTGLLQRELYLTFSLVIFLRLMLSYSYATKRILFTVDFCFKNNNAICVHCLVCDNSKKIFDKVFLSLYSAISACSFLQRSSALYLETVFSGIKYFCCLSSML